MRIAVSWHVDLTSLEISAILLGRYSSISKFIMRLWQSQRVVLVADRLIGLVSVTDVSSARLKHAVARARVMAVGSIFISVLLVFRAGLCCCVF